MIRLKDSREIDGIRRSGHLLARALAALAAETREGITTRDLDVFVRAYLSARGPVPPSSATSISPPRSASR